MNAKDEFNKTALHYAGLYRAKDLAEKLMISGADPFAKDYMGRRPIDNPMIQELFEKLRRNAVMVGTHFIQ